MHRRFSSSGIQNWKKTFSMQFWAGINGWRVLYFKIIIILFSWIVYFLFIQFYRFVEGRESFHRRPACGCKQSTNECKPQLWGSLYFTRKQRWIFWSSKCFKIDSTATIQPWWRTKNAVGYWAKYCKFRTKYYSRWNSYIHKHLLKLILNMFSFYLFITNNSRSWTQKAKHFSKSFISKPQW